MAYNVKLNGVDVKTKDGSSLMGSGFGVEIKEMNEEDRSFLAIGSDESEDSDKDIVRQEGWDLKRYKKNGIGLLMHSYWSLPIFKVNAKDVWVDGKKLIFRPIFAKTDQASEIFDLYKSGFMKAFSVGFRPIEWKWRDLEQRWEGGKEFIKQELLEISAVSVPANPNAVITSDGKSVMDDNNFVKLGYSEEMSKTDSNIWIPIRNVDYYKSPIAIDIIPGVKLISGIPVYEEKESVLVGYQFDASLFNEDSALKYAKANAPNSIVKVYYSFDYDGEDFKCDMSEEEVPVKAFVDKSTGEKDPECPDGMGPDGSGCAECKEKGCSRRKKDSAEDPICPDGMGPTGSGCADCETEGCTNRKPKSIDENITNDKSIVINSEEFFTKFDNALNTMVQKFQSLLEKNPPADESLKSSQEEDTFIEIDDFEVPPVSDKSVNDDELEIELEEIKQVTDDIEVTFDESLKSMFRDMLNKETNIEL